jgi:surface antigen
MKNKRYLILFTLIIFLVSSCSSINVDKSSFMKTTSTAVGGYFGYELSDGDLVSTTVGSTLGALIGTYLVEFINQDDYYFFKQETLRILEINDNNFVMNSGYWKNPKSGNRGVVKIVGYYGSPECRLIENIYVKGDQTSNSYGTACREKSGQWAMVR